MKNKIMSTITSVVLSVGILLINPGIAFAAPEADDYNVQVVMQKVGNVDINNLQAKSAVLVDGVYGNVLFEKDSHQKLPIASVTKVMTMLLVIEAIDSGKLKFDEKVQVSEYAAGMGGSQAYLKPGEEFTVSDMLKAVAIHSSNDVSVSLAEKIEGSEATFVGKMNDKAKELGMNDTLFADCTGLSDEQGYSSAHDIAVMSQYLISHHPKILEYTSVWHDTFRDGKFLLDNTNKLLKLYNGADGLKTGFTSKAGYCLSATASKNGFRLISVVLGEPDTNTRFAETKALLDYGFINYQLITANKKGEKGGDIKIRKGVERTVSGIFNQDVKIPVLRSDKNKITKELKLDREIMAPVAKGQKVGQVIYKIGDKEIARADLVADKKIERGSFVRLFARMLLGWIGIKWI